VVLDDLKEPEKAKLMRKLRTGTCFGDQQKYH
jgi:hypothetical protein